jgi:hypothetical protein
VRGPVRGSVSEHLVCKGTRSSEHVAHLAGVGHLALGAVGLTATLAAHGSERLLEPLIRFKRAFPAIGGVAEDGALAVVGSGREADG